MVLNDAIQVHQFAVDIVDHLDLGWRSHEVKRRPAREHFDVTVVLRKARDDVVSESTLAADPRDDGICHGESRF
ncbi:hypothetical protein Y026_4505 [Burkholderia pseudomallei TSV28]|nr:hypothetical protein Y026_4505 [Burkholderia pseudomallei TSV28]